MNVHYYKCKIKVQAISFASTDIFAKLFSIKVHLCGLDLLIFSIIKCKKQRQDVGYLAEKHAMSEYVKYCSYIRNINLRLDFTIL